MLRQRIVVALMVAALLTTAFAAGFTPAAVAGEGKTLKVLFIGNSFTARHNLSQVVKAMAEAGNPGLNFDVTTVIYGGRTLADHWRLGTPNFVRIASLTAADEQATLKSLAEDLKKKPDDKYAQSAIARHQALAKSLPQPIHWDIVVLQSYRDDLQGETSSYVQYAPKYAEMIKAQGGRVVLYETTPTTQNEKPLASPPDPAPVRAKAKVIAALGKQIDATVVPMSTVALRCQTQRPDLTLRFVNDSHLNQTMAYLTACTFYAALFDRSPVGISVTTVTDTKTASDKGKDLGPDGAPLKQTFSAKDAADLQRIAWEGLQEFRGK
jgi:hypothetical protein